MAAVDKYNDVLRHLNSTIKRFFEDSESEANTICSTMDDKSVIKLKIILGKVNDIEINLCNRNDQDSLLKKDLEEILQYKNL